MSENGFRNKNAQIIYSHKERAYYLSMDDFLSSKEAQANVGEFSSSAGTNYMGSHGLILIIFIVAVCVLTVIGKKIFALAPAAVNFLMVIYDSFFSTSLHGESDFASVDVSFNNYCRYYNFGYINIPVFKRKKYHMNIMINQL